MAESESFARKFWQQIGALIGVVASIAGIAGFFLSLESESSTPTTSGAEITYLREMNEHLAAIRRDLAPADRVRKSFDPNVRDVPPAPRGTTMTTTAFPTLRTGARRHPDAVTSSSTVVANER